jgi:RTA1 like protein
MSDERQPSDNLYPYQPSKILPVVFAVLVFLSLALHTLQNFRYRFWRITFFLFYANLIWLTGWILRAISTHFPFDLPLYIAGTIFIYMGPPIYAAAEYNILGRLMDYLPMHASLNPRMVKYFFIYLGALVEALTAAGAARMANSDPSSDGFQNGGTLLAVATVLQGTIELVYLSMIGLLHYRCTKSGMFSRNVKTVVMTLYGCSTLVLLRSIFRAVEAFSMYGDDCVYCGSVTKREWYLYALEAAPMIIYTFWLNAFHPGRFLPTGRNRYLDVDGKTERVGPGWIDERGWVQIAADPFNWLRDSKAGGDNTKFWLSPEKWVVCEDGSFARGTATNRRGKRGVEQEITLKGYAPVQQQKMADSRV